MLCDGLEAVPLKISPAECASELFESLVVDAAPLAWPGVSFDIQMTRASRDCNSTVLLTGIGGDDVFSGDLRVFADRARRGAVILGGARRRHP